MKKLFINNKKVITDKFRGVNAIHQLYNYMPDKDGRMNTPELIELELDTLKKMGIKQVRSFYGSSLSWDKEKGVHDFESEWMQAFYKNCKDLEKLGIEIGITPQWHMQGLWKEVPETCKVQGVNLDYNGCIVPGDMEATAKNFEKFIEESVLAFERHGITNIKYLYCFTECNNSFIKWQNDGRTTCERRSYHRVIPYYDRFIRAVDQGLKNAGMRDKYKIVAPCDNWRADDGSEPYSILTKYTADHLSNEVDIIGAHSGYDRASAYDEDAFYDLPLPKCENPKTVAEKLGKEHWVDEFNVELHCSYSAKDKMSTYQNPMRGVAFGAMVNSLLNMGYVHNVLIWALYSQQWPNSHAGGERSEFVDGSQKVGYIENLRESTTPTKAWYSFAMISRYLGEGKVYECQIDRPLYVSAIDRTDGEFTVLVTSYEKEKIDFEVNFAKELSGKTLYRYLYNPETIEATPGNNMIQSDKTIENVSEGFRDLLPGCCVALYTTEKPE